MSLLTILFWTGCYLAGIAANAYLSARWKRGRRHG